MPNKPQLTFSQIQDQYVRKNFENLDQYFKTQNQLLDFKFFELVFTSAQTGFKKAHGLGVIPLDAIITRISGPGVVTFKYADFDATNISMDVSDACRVRFYLGTYSQLASSTQAQATDTQDFFAKKPVLDTTAAAANTALSVVTKIGNYLATADDDIILCDASAGAFSISLPPASSNTKRKYIKKIDSTLNAVTIIPSGSAKLDLSSNKTLNTANESYEIYPNVNNWTILSHVIPMIQKAWTPTISNFGTVSNVEMYSWRMGQFLYIQGRFQAGSTTANPGTMSLGFNGIDGGLTIDSLGTLTRIAGVYFRGKNSVGDKGGTVLIDPSGTVLNFSHDQIIGSSAQNAFLEQNANNVATSGDAIGINAILPIKGWDT